MTGCARVVGGADAPVVVVSAFCVAGWRKSRVSTKHGLTNAANNSTVAMTGPGRVVAPMNERDYTASDARLDLAVHPFALRGSPCILRQ